MAAVRPSQKLLLKARQDLSSVNNGSEEIAMALISDADVFAEHLKSAANQLEMTIKSLREIAEMSEKSQAE